MRALGDKSFGFVLLCLTEFSVGYYHDDSKVDKRARRRFACGRVSLVNELLVLMLQVVDERSSEM